MCTCTHKTHTRTLWQRDGSRNDASSRLLSVDRRNSPATSSQRAFHHGVTTCQLQSPSLRHTALIFTNCAAAWDTAKQCQKYDNGKRTTTLSRLLFTQTPTWRLRGSNAQRRRHKWQIWPSVEHKQTSTYQHKVVSESVPFLFVCFFLFFEEIKKTSFTSV